MSTVAPNGIVRLLKDVPLDDKFEDTLWFDSVQAQEQYFLGLTPVHTMYNATRVKDHEGVVSIDTLEDNILECNYIMFQNQNFSGKWFYAFITGRKYINTNTTWVYYKIDPLQTYGFNIHLMDCLVERETTATDAIGEHTIGENVGAPELKLDKNLITEGYDSEMDAIVFTDVELDGQSQWVASGIHCINGILSMYNPLAVAESYINNEGQVVSGSWSFLEGVLQSLVADNKSDAIIGGICMPHVFNKRTTQGSSGVDTYSTATLYDGLDGYTPKNNKMYNSPYCVVRLQTSDGQSVFLQPEYLEGQFISVRYISVTSMTPELAIIPRNYKGQDLAYSEALSFTAFPQFQIAVDGYKAWAASGGLKTAELALSQTQRSIDLANEESITKGVWDVGKNIASGVSSYASGDVGGIVNAVAGVGDSFLNTEFQVRKNGQTLKFANENFDLKNAIAKTFPPSTKGQQVGSALATDNKIGFTVDKMTINYDNAKAIDDYFTMFGYTVNVVKKPILHNRSRFTYIKTCGCKVSGGAPVEYITAIETIMNKGIRFWADHEHIGDYDYARNVPLGNNAS